MRIIKEYKDILLILRKRVDKVIHVFDYGKSYFSTLL